MYLGQNIKQILPGNVAVGGANMGMVPLFSVMWCPSRVAIWAGYVPADGQELSQNLYPDAYAGIAANNVPTTSNANWISDPAARGAYVAESSPGMFRVPDLNGKSAGSLGAVFLRGDGAMSAGVAGVIQLDQFRSHDHTVNHGTSSGSANDLAPNGGVMTDSVTAATVDWVVNNTGGAETRPLNVTGCWAIKLFGAVTNMASADAAQLASSYASLSANKVDIASFLGSNQKLSASGYQKLPGGLIIQWGVSTAKTVTFPVAFPTACHRIISEVTGFNSSVSVAAQYFCVTSRTETGFTLADATASFPLEWLAIGN